MRFASRKSAYLPMQRHSKPATPLKGAKAAPYFQSNGMGMFRIGGLLGTSCVSNVLRLIGQPALSGDGTVGSVCFVLIWVVWVHQQKEDGWPYVVSAFEAFIDGHYDRVIVPAQSAIEISLMPVIRELLERHASGDHVSGFMGDRLTFGHAINVILPFVCGQAGVPKLPEKIRISLNKLRKLRNTIVHSGTGGDKITSQQAAEALCAAVFGFEYVRYTKPKLLAWLK